MPPVTMTYGELRPIADMAADRYDVDALALLALWYLESSWRPDAVNTLSWATGLGGVLSHESAAIYGGGFTSRPTVEELKDPAVNADWSASILADNLERYDGDLRRAVKAYSGGWGVAGDTAFDAQYWKPFEAKLAQLRKEHYMDMSKYPRPANDTGAGVHGGANGYFPLGDNEGLYPTILDEMYRCGLRWVKLLDCDGASHNASRKALEMGFVPVVRLYRPQPYPGVLSDKQKGTVGLLAALGVRYFERGNEPNVAWEWQPAYWPGNDWNNWTDAVFNKLAADWLADAQYIASQGGLVAVDACSPGGDYDDIMYLERFLKALKLLNGAASLLHDYGWLAVHNAGLNHPLAYPDDAINQASHPGQTIHSHYYVNGTPTGASNCIRKPEAVYRVFQNIMGFPLPVITTEGGFWPGSRQDPRYPELTNETAGQVQADALRSMATAPAWFLAQMPWLWANRVFANLHEGFERDAWFRVPGWGNCPPNDPPKLPVMGMLLASPCLLRTAPAPPPPLPVPPVSVLEQTIGDALQTVVVPLNPSAAFEIAGAAKGLLPASPELDVVYQGVTYLCQVYRDEVRRDRQYVVYARLGEWQRLIWFERAN